LATVAWTQQPELTATSNLNVPSLSSRSQADAEGAGNSQRLAYLRSSSEN